MDRPFCVPRLGWRVLLVDLDLHASLTSLFFSGEQIRQAADAERLIQHFFERAAAGAQPELLEFIHARPEPRVQLVGSADTLAYAELFLTMHWLLRSAEATRG